MKWISAVCLAIIVAFTFLTSCSTLRSGNPVKAAYNAEEVGWASRNVPGVKALSNLVPPPSDARTKWDQYLKKRQEPWNMENDFN